MRPPASSAPLCARRRCRGRGPTPPPPRPGPDPRPSRGRTPCRPPTPGEHPDDRDDGRPAAARSAGRTSPGGRRCSSAGGSGSSSSSAGQPGSPGRAITRRSRAAARAPPRGARRAIASAAGQVGDGARHAASLRCDRRAATAPSRPFARPAHRLPAASSAQCAQRPALSRALPARPRVGAARARPGRVRNVGAASAGRRRQHSWRPLAGTSIAGRCGRAAGPRCARRSARPGRACSGTPQRRRESRTGTGSSRRPA